MCPGGMSTPSPPPPLDSPGASDPLDCPELKWGLIGCGRVCHDFTQALKHVPTASVVACSARDLSRAEDFASKHGIPKAYGSYDELVQDDDVQIVYVGNVHAFRRPVVEKCLLADKHVLVEKPFACSSEDAKYLIDLAKRRDLFVLEGMWTRFFPAVEQARRFVFGADDDDKGIIGEVVSVMSDFNFNASDSEHYPTSFVYNRKLGGGASLLVAPYPMAAVTMFFPGSKPDRIKVVGQIDEKTEVDLQASIALSYPPTGNVPPALDENNTTGEKTPKLPGAAMATLSYGMLCESEEQTTVVGTKGRLTIETPGHCPTKLKVSFKESGRGNVKEMEYHFPLPDDTEDIIKAGGFVYPNSAGFCYEAAAVARCVAAGKKHAPQYTPDETMIVMNMIDEVRSQLGTKGVHDD